METVLNVVFFFIMAFGLCIIFFIVLPFFMRASGINKSLDKTSEKLPNLLATFNGTHGVLSGMVFIKLMKLGYFQHLKTGNHGHNFPDKKQYQCFLRYATPEITQSLRNIGDSFEKYFI